MRVGFLLSGSLDTLTGGYIYDRQLVNYLRLKGHQVNVLNIPFCNYLDRLLNSPKLSFYKQPDGLSFDILLEDELDHPAFIFANRRLKSICNCPIISIVHNLRSCESRTKWQNKAYSLVEQQYFRTVDGYIFNSRATRQAVEDLVGTLQPGIIANPGGNRLHFTMTETEIIERAKTPGPLRIIYLGNVTRNKGLHILLDALAAIPAGNYHLSIVGDLTMDKPYVKK